MVGGWIAQRSNRARDRRGRGGTRRIVSYSIETSRLLLVICLVSVKRGLKLSVFRGVSEVRVGCEEGGMKETEDEWRMGRQIVNRGNGLSANSERAKRLYVTLATLLTIASHIQSRCPPTACCRFIQFCVVPLVEGVDDD